MLMRSLRRYGFLLLLIGALLIAPLSNRAFAASPSEAKISFTFDDGFESTLLAASTLQPYGYTGTSYITTNCIGMAIGDTTTACEIGNDKKYMTWAQVAQLSSQYGWEIGSHTKSHPLTALGDRTEGDLTDAELDNELSGSQAVLQTHGYQALSYASPYGDYDNRSIAAAAKYYTSHRTFWDLTYSDDPIDNSFPYYYPHSVSPYNDYLLTVMQVQGNIPVSEVKTYIDQAKTNGQWLILVFHDIKAANDSTYNSSEEAYEYRTDYLAQIAAYAQIVGLANSSMTGGLVSGYNIMPNSSFTNGISEGWTTDAPTAVTLDSQSTSLLGHGSYDGTVTGPQKSIKVTNNGTAVSRLTSPRIRVAPGTNYTLKNFINVTSTSGQVSFAINEFDADESPINSTLSYAGVKGSTTSNAVQVGNVNFTYTPSSAEVKYAQLTVIFTGANLTAYVDTLQWLSPTPAIVIAKGDVNEDGLIDALDLSVVLSRWNTSQTHAYRGDLNSDGIVDALDLSIILSNWSS